MTDATLEITFENRKFYDEFETTTETAIDMLQQFSIILWERNQIPEHFEVNRTIEQLKAFIDNSTYYTTDND